MNKACLLSLFLVIQGVAFGQPVTTLSDEEKIFGLSYFWQEVNYNFAFFSQVPELDWDSTYRAFIPEVLATQNDYEYYRCLQRFCALLEDGHTNVYMPQRIDSLLYSNSFGDYRIFLENINGRAIVTRINEPRREEIPIGSEVVAVNGLPTRQYLEQEVLPYIASSTDYIRWDVGIRSLLRGFRGGNIAITVRTPKGEERNLTLTRALNPDKVYPPFPDWSLMEFRWLNEDIAYVSLNSFGDPKIDTLFVEIVPDLLKAKGLVLDLRKNGGGSTQIGLEIAKYLTTDSLLYGSRSMTPEHRAAYKAWGYWINQQPQDTIGDAWAKRSFDYFNNAVWHEFEWKPDTNDISGPRITVPTVILTGHHTASAAEDFLVYMDNQPHMARLGRKTYGSTGQPLFIDLPGGGTARICTKRDVFPDGREFVGYGILPQVEVNPTVKDFMEDRDAALERARAYLEDKIE